jgi:nitrite reductase/ring-hydroxylating ferredoxin subunit
MKKIIVALLFIGLISSCDSGSVNYNNPYLPNYQVDLPINISLPQYSNLQFAGNYIIDYSQGVKGIVVFNTGTGYTAFDIACPNQDLSACSTMTISAPNAICSCDDSSYSLFTGIAPGKDYPMKPYRVQISGSYLYITN